MRFLINEDGRPFDDEELVEIGEALKALPTDEDRIDYRDRNAEQIATSPAERMLIVSGPGTGKSRLFLERIEHWLDNDASGEILVTSFVNKLVDDLNNKVNQLPEGKKRRVTVFTLHRLARSIVEKNLGTTEWRFERHIRIIGEEWKEVVWADVQQFHPEADGNPVLDWRSMERQLYNDSYSEEEVWELLRKTYYKLCKFYNAAGFADLIVRAREALDENPGLSTFDYFIIDEYQDFNLAEQTLLNKMTEGAKGFLIVGDDDQVLYETLKQGKASFIREIYADENFVNAMLPFCSRCGYNIVQTADAFLRETMEEDRINKLFLPLSASSGSDKGIAVACAHPASVLDYIEQFITTHREEIEERRRELTESSEEDPFLLILTPIRDATFLSEYASKLNVFLDEYVQANNGESNECERLSFYIHLAKDPNDNFTFRRVLAHEGCSPSDIHPWIDEAMESGVPMCQLEKPKIQEVIKKCETISSVIGAECSADEKSRLLCAMGIISTPAPRDLDAQVESLCQRLNSQERLAGEDEQDEVDCSGKNVVELMSIPKAKGLTSDYVIVIGFDDVNMSKVAPSAFYVAITRPRKSLHLVTSLRCSGASSYHPFMDSLPQECFEFCTHSKEKGTCPLTEISEFTRYFDSIRYQIKRSKS